MKRRVIYSAASLTLAFLAFQTVLSGDSGKQGTRAVPMEAAPATPRVIDSGRQVGMPESVDGAATTTGGLRAGLPHTIYVQPPNQAYAYFSDPSCFPFLGQCASGQQSMADNFSVGEPKLLTAVRFWGGYAPTNQAGTDHFGLIIHADAAGTPGIVLHAETDLAAARTQTGQSAFGLVEWVYDAPLSAPVALEAGTVYWLEIYNTGGLDAWGWESGAGAGDNARVAPQAPGSAWASATPFSDLAFELTGEDILQADCNSNGIEDLQDIASGFSLDCNSNLIPDECDIANDPSLDCNGNGTIDICDIWFGLSLDCNSNAIPDECDIAPGGGGVDCNGNGIPDQCELNERPMADCNANGTLDVCDIASGASLDCNFDAIPDECELGATDTIYAVDRDSGGLYEIDVSAILSGGGGGYGRGIGYGSGASLVGYMDQDVYSAYGLSIQPSTGVLYAVVGQGSPARSSASKSGLAGTAIDDQVVLGRGAGYGGSGRMLARVNRLTAQVAIIGELADPISDIAFRANGTLYGIVGNGGDNPGEIVMINLADATAVSTGWIRGSGGGHSIAFHPGTGLLHHAAYPGLETIDVDTGATTLISESVYREFNAIAFHPSGDPFIGCSFGTLYLIDPATGNYFYGGPISYEFRNINATGAGYYIRGGDCNGNGIPDDCDIAEGTSQDCNGNGIPDSCEPDCNANGVADDCDLAAGTSEDCNYNSVPDECDLASGTSHDINTNGVLDDCEDCNGNGLPDEIDLNAGTSPDCDGNGVPDECDLAAGAQDIYVVSGNNPQLYILDPASGGVSVVGTMDQSIYHALGLAVHPITGQLYAIVEMYESSGRLLAIVDRQTASATIIGPLAELLSDIAFSFDGTLFGVQGNGSSSPGDIVMVSTVDATFTPTGISMGEGGGQSIAFRPGSNVLYHIYGCCPSFSGVTTLSAIDLAGPTVTTVATYPFDIDSRALTFHPTGRPLIGIGNDGMFEININTGALRVVSDPAAFVTGMAYVGSSADCNENLVLDPCDVIAGTSQDCNANGVPDECEEDCNSNGLADACDIAAGTSLDCNANGIPDECDLSGGTIPDCNTNGLLDECETAGGVNDCNGNGIPDECDLLAPPTSSSQAQDVCVNAQPVCPGTTYSGTTVGSTNDGSASCASSGSSPDVWYTYTPGFSGTATISLCGSSYDTALSVHSACPGTSANQLNCNDDSCGLSSQLSLAVTANTTYWIRIAGYSSSTGSFVMVLTGPECPLVSADCNGNGIPDDCDIASGALADCNSNGLGDACEIADGDAEDCNTNGIPDACDIASATSQDCNSNGVPDECEADCNGNGAADECDIANETESDCNRNNIPDSCDIASGVSEDCDTNQVPDECQLAGGGVYMVSGHTADFGWDTAGWDSGYLIDNTLDWLWVNYAHSGSILLIRDNAAWHDSWRRALAVRGRPYTEKRGNVVTAADFAPGAFNLIIIAEYMDDSSLTNISSLVGAMEAYVQNGGVLVDMIGTNFTRRWSQGVAGPFGTRTDSNNGGNSYVVAVGHGMVQSMSLPYISGSSDHHARITTVPANSIVLLSAGTSPGGVPTACWLEFPAGGGGDTDCNYNRILDACEIADGTGEDCNTNGALDDCDIADGTSDDCNSNGIPDECDVAGGASADCDRNGVPDECEGGGEFVDCNLNGIADSCDIYDGTSLDCNTNGIPDECEDDCNANGVPDDCDISAGTSDDCDTNALPDECELDPDQNDCNTNGILDVCDLASGTSEDCNSNHVPDECDIVDDDCNGNGIPDDCDIVAGLEADSVAEFSNTQGMFGWSYGYYEGVFNGSSFTPMPLFDGIKWYVNRPPYYIPQIRSSFVHPDTGPERWAVRRWTSDVSGAVRITGHLAKSDTTCGDGIRGYVLVNGAQVWSRQIAYNNGMGVDLAIETPVNVNSIVDFAVSPAGSNSCDGTIFTVRIERAGAVADCNGNGVPDDCDVAGAASPDCNTNGVPDECDRPDCNHNGIPDDCDIASGTSEDLNVNGIADECDAALFRQSISRAATVVNLIPAEPFVFTAVVGRAVTVHNQLTPPPLVFDHALARAVTVQNLLSSPMHQFDEVISRACTTYNVFAAPNEEVRLQVTACAGPSEAGGGETIDVGWSVTNIDARDAIGFWEDKVFLSSDPTIGNDTEIGTFVTFGPLGPGASYDRMEQVVIPTQTVGPRWLIVTSGVSPIHPAAEGDNALVCGALMVLDTDPPTTSILTGPADGAYLNVADVTFTWIGADNATSTPNLLYSACLAPAAAGCDPAAGPFSSDTTGTFSGLTEEDSPYVFKVAAQDEAGNVDPTPVERQFWIDFTPPMIVAQNPTDTVYQPVCQIDVTFDEPVTGFDAADVSLVGPDGPINVTSVANTGDGRTFEIHFACQAHRGAYQLTVGPDIVDRAGNAMAAAYEGGFAPSLPDLEVTSIVAPQSGIAGRQLALSWTVTNTGDQPAIGTWTDRVWLSGDAQIGGDTLTGNFTFSGTLATGDSYTRTDAVTVPAGAAGEGYFVVATDAGPGVAEFDDANNISIDDIPIVIAVATYPDLVVESVTPPPQAFSGQPAEFQWVVRNVGTAGTNSPSWTDRIVLSIDSTFGNGDDRVLGNATNPSYLAVDEAYVQSASVTMPLDVIGQLYVFVRTDINNQVGESNENNNVGAPATFVCQLAPPPDLQVTSIVVASNAFSGDMLTVSWTAANLGSGPITGGTWTDRVYLSADEALGQGDTLLASLNHSGPLAAGAGYNAGGSYQLPQALFGDFYVLVFTDATDTVFEHEFNDNNVRSAGHLTTITLTPPADLAVYNVQAPSVAVSSFALTVTYTVTNEGAATAYQNWNDSIYLSADAVLSAGTDLLLGSFNRPYGLAPGDSYIATRTPTLPNGLEGSYYVFVFADSNNAIFEYTFNENNVASAASPVTIAVQPADLQVTSVTAPSAANTNTTVNVQWTVSNNGTGATPTNSWSDRVYISSDTGLGGDPVLATVAHAGALNPGASYSASASVTIPNGLNGPYYFLVQTDAFGQVYEHGPGEGNNVRASAPPTQITLIGADLIVSSVTAPSTGEEGQAFTVSWTATNAGNGATNVSAWTDRVYLSGDAAYGSGDLLIGSFTHNGTLGDGASYSPSQSATVPYGTSGTFYVLVVTDALNAVYELNDSNNTGTSAAPFSVGAAATPNLIVENVNAPANGASGQNISVTYTIRNTGAGPTFVSSWYDAIYLSLDQILDTSADRYITSVNRNAVLGPSATYTPTVAVQVPAGFSGPYYVFVITDSTNRVFEGGLEGDNRGYDPTPVNVYLAPPGDLTVDALSLPSTGQPGVETSISWTVRNASADTTVAGTWEDAVYLSADTTWDIGDKLVARVSHTQSAGSPLSPGGTYTGQTNAALPGVVPGDYHAIVRADIRNNLFETNETNNLTVSADVMSVDCIELTVDVPYNDQWFTGQSRYFKVVVPAGETLRVTLDASVNTGASELFIRYGQVPDRVHFDDAFDDPFGADQVVTVPTTRPGTYYILAYADYVPFGPRPYAIVANSLPFSITGIEPATGGNVAAATVRITGAQFEQGTEFSLITADQSEITATAVYPRDASVAYATFDLLGAAAGSADAEAVNPDQTVANGAGLFTIVNGGGPQLAARIVAPDSVRAGRPFSVRIEYANHGNGDMPAPLLELRSSRPVEMSLNPDGVYHTSLIRTLGVNFEGPAGVLPAGAFGFYTVYFHGASEGNLQLGLIRRGSGELVNWDTEQTAVRPPNVGNLQWEAVWNRLKNHVGDTWARYEQAMAKIATRRWLEGALVYDVETLFADELELAWEIYPSRISGTLVDDQFGQPLAGVLVQARSEDENGDAIVISEVTTDAQGFFEHKVSPGVYTFFAQGYYFDPPVSAAVGQDEDVRDLELRAIVQPEPEVIPPFIPPAIADRTPALATDAAGNVHLAFNRGGEIWHGRWGGAAWSSVGPVESGVGFDPKITRAPAGQADDTVVVAWQDGVGNDSSIKYALGMADEADPSGYVWSAAVDAASDSYGNVSPAVALTPAGELLLVWLKRDFDIEDDTDLYYGVGPVIVLSTLEHGPQWPDPEPALLMADPSVRLASYLENRSSPTAFADDPLPGLRALPIPDCISWQFGNKSYLTLPILGGKYGFDISVQGCGDKDCVWTGSGGLSGSAKLGDRFSITVGGTGSFKFITNKKDCTYDFDNAKISFSGSGSVKFPVNDFAMLFKVAERWLKLDLGVSIGGGIGGEIKWSGPDFPGWPTSGQGTWNITGGPYGSIKASDSTGGAITGSLRVQGNWGVAPWYITLTGVCLDFKATVSIGNLLKFDWKYQYPSGCGGGRSIGDSYPPGALVVRLPVNGPGLRDGEEGVQEVIITVEPLYGTGSVYPGQTVLADVTTDFRNDGKPSLATGPAGQVLSVWTKDSAVPEVELGSAVVAAEYDPAGWPSPTPIVSAADFNADPQVVFDTAGTPMAVWSQASTAGLSTESPVQDVLDAQAVSDLVYSQRIAGTWTAPAPVAALQGSDQEPALAADSTGRILAAWQHTDAGATETLVYAAIWEGSSWSAAEAVATTAATETISCAFAAGTPLVVWSADADGDPDATPNDITIYFSTYNGGWSAPAALPKDAQRGADQNGSDQDGPARGLDPRGPFSPPDECCECKTAQDCDDMKSCTEDECVDGQCKHNNRDDRCDTDWCDGEDKCDPTNPAAAASGCVELSGPPCQPPMLCDEANDRCVECLTDADCNDNVSCTIDTCNNGTCDRQPQDSLCDDGQWCTGQEKCDATTDCQPGDPPCPPASMCNEAEHKCECSDPAQCDDGIACTMDDCPAGVCVNTPDNSLCPDDGQFCNGDEYCEQKSGCDHRGDPCPPGWTCNETEDRCEECQSDADCDDMNDCTLDSCNPASKQCVHQAQNSLCPDDNNACNGQEYCDVNIGCTRTPPPNCGQSDACNYRYCDPASGCQSQSLDCTPKPQIVRPVDPNEKIGPAGYGEEHWIPVGDTLLYTILFENKPDASASAQVVTITDPLSDKLDWRAFRLVAFGFGNRIVEAPANRSFYLTDVPLNDGSGLNVRINAGIDIQTGQARWILTAIDPATGELPTDPSLGFLPPNDPEVHDGEGFVTFTIKSRRDVPTGSVISNMATIVFDINEPIDTNTVSNTLDADAPLSEVTALPEEVPLTFDVQWSGDDPEGGSGLAHFDIYASENGEPFALWRNATDLTAPYTGLRGGAAYAFYCVATDNAGNKEPAPVVADTATIIQAQTPIAPTIGDIGAFTVRIVDLGSANMESVEHAVFEESTGKFVAADGALVDTAVWQPLSAWNGLTVGGLRPLTDYTFRSQARSASVVTELGPPTTVTTAQVAAGAATVSLNTGDLCLNLSSQNTLTVSVDMTGAVVPIVGGEFYVAYDADKLTFVDVQPGGGVFTTAAVVNVDTVAGTLDFTVGADIGSAGTPADTTLAVITFTAAGEVCSSGPMVRFRSNDPPTVVNLAAGGGSEPFVNDLPAITIDGTAPTFSSFPEDVQRSANARMCAAVITPSDILPVAVDNCPQAPALTWQRSDGAPAFADPFPVGTTTVTWTAADDCGNQTMQSHTVTVAPVNELIVDVEISPQLSDPHPGVPGDALTRCVEFELWQCAGDPQPAAVIRQDVTFPLDGAPHRATGVALTAPCGDYGCITARDPLHTLRSTAGNLGDDGVRYLAAFTDNPASGGHWLVSGNLNGDRWIDIVDFALFINRFGANYGSGDTACNATGPHADLSGNGTVGLEDFTFIQINFLRGDAPACCGLRGGQAEDNGPLMRISVDDLQRLVSGGDARAADLNGDGWVDQADVAEFLSRPQPESAPLNATPPRTRR